MDQGRPNPFTFSQRDPDLAPEQPEAALEGDPTPAPQVVEARPDRLENALRFGHNWSTNPGVPGQAKLYPDTVKIVDVRYKVFDTSDSSAMDEYSRICISNEAGGRYVFSSSETLEWSEATSKWLLLVRVTERAFKSLHTSTSDPNEP